MPKPLVPIGEKPILEIIIQQLIAAGFNHITITLNYLADIIKAIFGDGSKWGIKIDYSYEDKPLSTMGPLTLIKDLPDNFLVMNGDILTDLNFSSLYNDHCSWNNIFTISSFRRSVENDYGVLSVDSEGYVTKFEEKPTKNFNVSMGVYCANISILDYIPVNKTFGFDDLMLHLLRAGIPINTRYHDGYWLDIGRPEDYVRACEEIDSIL